MRGFDVDEWDFVGLLAATPCKRDEAQDYLRRGYGVRVPKTSYELIWDRLAERLGEDEAADAVCELALATAKPRLSAVLSEYDEHGEIVPRFSDPKIIDLLFDMDGYPTALGDYLLDYRRRTRTAPPPQAARNRAETRRSSTATAEPAAHMGLSELLDGDQSGPRSADHGAGWRLERVRASSATFLKARRGWKERDLEQFIVDNWSQIDFGLDEPLVLVGRQVRLKSTTEKVDLLARTPGGIWVAVELKIVPATAADFTQLLSYLQDLAFSGIPSDRAKGLLVAPTFAEKVLNAAAGDRRVYLLRYLSE